MRFLGLFIHPGLKFPNYRTDVTVDWPDEKQNCCMVFVKAYGITPWVREGAKLAGLSAQGGQVRYTLTANGRWFVRTRAKTDELDKFCYSGIRFLKIQINLVILLEKYLLNGQLS